MNTTKRFKSRKDKTSNILIYLTQFLLLGITLIVAGTDDVSFGFRLTFIMVIAILIFFIHWVFYSTFYIIEDETLTVRYGPFKSVIPIQLITRIEQTSELTTLKAATAIKRLVINYHKTPDAVYFSSLEISPENEDEFLAMLRKANKGFSFKKAG